MHARIDQLLSLRDGEPVDAQVASHVAQCAVCSGELQRLSTLRRRMRELPTFEPPGWEGIQTSMSRSPRARSRRVVAAAAGVAALAIGTALAIWSGAGRKDQHITTVRLEPAEAELSVENSVADLMKRSRRLEEMLGELPSPAIERVTTAGAIDSLERRIQWLDLQLSHAPEAGLSERQAERMWRERVDLMDSLVKVRYAESGYVAF
jgi:hypothetical protein